MKKVALLLLSLLNLIQASNFDPRDEKELAEIVDTVSKKFDWSNCQKFIINYRFVNAKQPFQVGQDIVIQNFREAQLRSITICVDYNQYKTLSLEEKQFAIAHEIAHCYGNKSNYLKPLFISTLKNGTFILANLWFIYALAKTKIFFPTFNLKAGIFGVWPLFNAIISPFFFLLSKLQQNEEFRCDQVAAEILKDNSGGINIYKNLKHHDLSLTLFTTHPNMKSRIDRLKKLVFTKDIQ